MFSAGDVDGVAAMFADDAEIPDAGGLAVPDPGESTLAPTHDLDVAFRHLLDPRQSLSRGSPRAQRDGFIALSARSGLDR
jgi:hypothetical protein